jgi:hypothetical protein
MTHGWPGSVFEFLKVIGPPPTRRPTGPAGGRFDPSFHRFPATALRRFDGQRWDPDHRTGSGRELMNRPGTRATSPRAATGAPQSPARWRVRRQRDCRYPPQLAGDATARSGRCLPSVARAGGTREGARGVRHAKRHTQKRELGVLRDDDRVGRRPSGTARRIRGPRGVASCIQASRIDVRRGSRNVADKGRCWTTSPCIADEERNLGRAPVLGERRARQRY